MSERHHHHFGNRFLIIFMFLKAYRNTNNMVDLHTVHIYCGVYERNYLLFIIFGDILLTIELTYNLGIRAFQLIG